MQQATHKTLYNTHSWIGIISGILLFIVTFSGIPALFEEELALWQTPGNQIINNQKMPDLDQALLVARNQGFNHSSFFIQPANDVNGHIIFAHYFDDHETPADIVHVSPESGQLRPQANSGLSELLAHLHTDLHLPNPWGRYLVGFSGMAMLLAIIAGIFIHVKWRREFVLIRPKRSWRLLLTDQHKLLGLWSLPFTLILAFTGTILGLLGLISPILAVAAFNGDVQKATDVVLGPRAEIAQQKSPSVSLNLLLSQQRQDMPEVNLEFIYVDGFNDKGGLIKFSGNHQSKLSNLETVTYQLTNGEKIHQGSFVEKGPFQRIFAAATPLHYVLYGDSWLKVLYALSALAACGLIISGNMLWLERRDPSKHQWLGQLTLGACGGLVVATGAVIAASQGLRLFDLQHQAQWESGIFWGSWISLMTLPFLIRNHFKLSHLMIKISGGLMALTLLADGFINQRWIWQTQDWEFNIQCGFLVSALLCLYLDAKIPHGRMHKKHTVAQKRPVSNENKDKSALDSAA